LNLIEYQSLNETGLGFQPPALFGLAKSGKVSNIPIVPLFGSDKGEVCHSRAYDATSDCPTSPAAPVVSHCVPSGRNPSSSWLRHLGMSLLKTSVTGDQEVSNF